MEKIKDVSKAMLSVLLTDPAILSQLLLEGEIAQKSRINDDGSITLSRSKWFWWSDFFKGTRTISFNDLAVKITNILAGVGVNKHPSLEKGLKYEYTSTIFNGDRDKLISCWLTTYLVAFDGEKADYIVSSDINPKVSQDLIGIPILVTGKNGPQTVVITAEQINDLNKMTRN